MSTLRINTRKARDRQHNSGTECRSADDTTWFHVESYTEQAGETDSDAIEFRAKKGETDTRRGLKREDGKFAEGRDWLDGGGGGVWGGEERSSSHLGRRPAGEFCGL